MTETYTFTTRTNSATLTVKKTFLEKCPEPSKYDLFELTKDFNVMTFLHNEAGPSVVRPKHNISEYWLDGICISVTNPELAKRIEHNIRFKQTVADVLSEPDHESK